MNIKKLRERHAEHIRLLGIAEDLNQRAESQPGAGFAAWVSRIALKMCTLGEERARAKARKTYES